MSRPPGLSVRWKLTLSYAGFLMVAGTLLLAVVWVFLLRYVPPDAAMVEGGMMPGRTDLVEAFAPRVTWALVFLLGFGLLGGWLLAGRMLAPLDRITAATRKASGGSLSHRVNLPGRKDEFRELADSFDHMLARLEAHVAEQERFAANASHELRTPLAISRTLLEVASNDPGYDREELLSRLQEVNARSIALTEALLLLSRSGQRGFKVEEVDLSLLVDEAVETLLPKAEKLGVDLQVEVEHVSTLGSRSLLRQMVMNFLDNALVHNLESDGFVRISTARERDSAVLVVENSGTMLAPELVATLTEPFQRGPGRIRQAHAGVGLGLAIAKSICQVHDGELELTPGTRGGLQVTVTLPLAEAGGRALVPAEVAPSAYRTQ